MIKLRDLVNDFLYSDISDMEIIKHYIIENNLEEEAIAMMADLSKAKMEKLRNKNAIAEEWVCMLPSDYLYKHYPLEIADKLHRIELDYLIHGKELTGGNIKWARENLPNIKEPECYFRPVINYLEEKGIYFKKAKRG